MAKTPAQDAHHDHADYVPGTMDISEQSSTFSLFMALAAWGSLFIAALLAFLTLWFMQGGSFFTGLLVGLVIAVGGGAYLRMSGARKH